MFSQLWLSTKKSSAHVLMIPACPRSLHTLGALMDVEFSERDELFCRLSCYELDQIGTSPSFFLSLPLNLSIAIASLLPLVTKTLSSLSPPAWFTCTLFHYR